MNDDIEDILIYALRWTNFTYRVNEESRGFVIFREGNSVSPHWLATDGKWRPPENPLSKPQIFRSKAEAEFVIAGFEQ